MFWGGSRHVCLRLKQCYHHGGRWRFPSLSALFGRFTYAEKRVIYLAVRESLRVEFYLRTLLGLQVS
jgi:hypothetical protein